MSIVTVRHLTKDYRIYSRRGQKFKEMLTFNRRVYHDTKRALDDVNFILNAGECLGIIGFNGSGKSTLLKILAQTSLPTTGEISINGQVSYILDPSTGFNPDFSGRENVLIKCALLGLSAAQSAALFDVIHDFSGLGDRIDHPLKSYSTGMVVRLGFSVAIHVPFDVLLIDEVLSVGDYLFQRKCINAIRKFKEQGKTIIVASHSLADVSSFCDRLLLLDDGRLVLQGETDKVVQAYVEDCEQRYGRIEGPIQQGLPIHDPALELCEVKLGQAHIEEVAFLDGAGRPAIEYESGAPMTIRIRFRTDEPLTNPCIRIQFLRNDGLLILGSNTYRHELEFGRVDGVYEADCHFPSLNILSGDYYLNVGVWPDEYQSFQAKTPYDAHEYKHIITIASKRIDGGGLALSPCQWKMKKIEDGS